MIDIYPQLNCEVCHRTLCAQHDDCTIHHQGVHITDLEVENMSLTTEVEVLRQALTWCSDIAWQGLDIDGGSFQDEMVRCRLLIEVPASEEIAAEFDTNVMFAWVWGDDQEATESSPDDPCAPR